MRRSQLAWAILVLATCFTSAQAGPYTSWSVSVGGPVYRPYYPYPYYGYGYYRPAYYGPAPIYLEAPPMVVVPSRAAACSPCAQPSVSQASPIPSEPPVIQIGAQLETPATTSVEGHLANLRNPSEAVRANSVLELGRMRAATAVDPLNATLAGDQSPVVRDAAARALGMIGSPRSLTVLMHSGQADADRDVRRSAQFAVDVIRSRQ